MKPPHWTARSLSYFSEHWNRICLLIGFFGAALLFVLSNFTPAIQTSSRTMTAFIFFTGGALIFVLLEIQQGIKREQGDETETNFTSARPKMIEEIIQESRKSKAEPMQVRLVGMRLTAIQQFLADIAYVARNNQLGRRTIAMKVYHVNPEFLLEQHPTKALPIDVPAEERFQNQVAVLGGVVAEIKAMFARLPNFNVEVLNYRNIPVFWAVDIERKTLFWGFFTWEKNEQNWIGPENRCFIYRAESGPNRFVMDGLLNRLDSLDEWAEPTQVESVPPKLDKKAGASS